MFMSENTCPCFSAGFKIQAEEISLTVTQGQTGDQSHVIGSHFQGDVASSVIAKHTEGASTLPKVEA